MGYEEICSLQRVHRTKIEDQFLKLEESILLSWE